MTKTFAAHLVDARNAKTAAEAYAVVKTMYDKLERNRGKIAWMHCKHGWACEAQHYSEKFEGWAKLCSEARAIFTEKAKGLTTAEVVAMVSGAQA